MFRPRRRDRALRRLVRRLVRSRTMRPWAPPPVNARGDRLDPQLAVILRLMQLVDDGRLPPVDERRALFRRSTWLGSADPLEVPTRDGAIGGHPARWYEPPNASGALVFVHGGGWVVGDLDTHDALCRRLAVRGERVVVALTYPRAPEHPWPAPVHTVADAWRALHPELSERFSDVAFAGTSAGGNLVACASRLLRDAGDPLPTRQVLIYPGLDATLSGPSHREFAEGFMLSAASIRWYLDQYRPEPLDPLASPVLAPDLEGLPEAWIVVAGFDPLRDEGLRYARRLAEAGIPVRLFDLGDMIHGFAGMDGVVDAARAHLDALARALRAEPGTKRV